MNDDNGGFDWATLTKEMATQTDMVRLLKKLPSGGPGLTATWSPDDNCWMWIRNVNRSNQPTRGRAERVIDWLSYSKKGNSVLVFLCLVGMVAVLGKVAIATDFDILRPEAWGRFIEERAEGFFGWLHRVGDWFSERWNA